MISIRMKQLTNKETGKQSGRKKKHPDQQISRQKDGQAQK